jgi:NADH:ubiquinone oxidoreductase subunit 6 (subunit J)
MELTTILFYLFSVTTLGAAAVMVFSRNIVHSAFALMFTLIGVAALYVLLYADFLAATQLLVYVGGILILILFGVMLTTQGHSFSFKINTVNLIPASVLSVSNSCTSDFCIHFNRMDNCRSF